MNLTSPWLAWWLLAAIPIIVFYILRTRLRQQPVATLLFWDQLFDEKRQRSLWNRLRHWLSLLLQLAFLGLVVAALVDPLWSGQKENARQIVIVLDNSASMQATDSKGYSRFAAAKESALGIVAGLRDGDEIALMTAGSSVRVVVGMTDFAPAIRDAIAAVKVTDGPTRVIAAVESARRLTRSPRRREIIVLSDLCFEGAETLVKSTDVKWVAVGKPLDNVGITSLAVRRSLVDPIGYAALVTVKNFGQSAAKCRLTFQLDGSLVDVIPLNLAAGESTQKTMVRASAEGGVLSASLKHDDGLALDNRALAVLPRRPPIPVVLVSEQPSLYLESVLKAIPLVDLTTVATIPSAAPANGFIVLNRIAPEQLSEPGELPTGNVLAIDPRGDSDWWTLGETITQPIVAKQDADSPLLPHVRLLNVSLPGARALDVVENATKLLTDASGATLMASMVRGDDRSVVLSTDLENGDLPLRIAFPVMMTNAVNWFLSRTGEIQPAIRTGELAEVASGADDANTAWMWIDAAGETAPATRSESAAMLGPVNHVGIVRIGPRQVIESLAINHSAPSATSMTVASELELTQVAVNLSDAGESDLTPRVELEPGELLLAGSARRSIWFYLTFAALGLIIAEWFLYQRRVVA